MKNRFAAWTFWMVVLGFSAVVFAQEPAQRSAQQPAAAIPRTADGKPDLSGKWKTITSRVGRIQPTPWGAKRYDYNKLPEGTGARPELDPISYCYRPGLARLGPPLLVPASSVRVRKEGESVPAPGGPAALDAIVIAYSPQKVWIVHQYNQEMRQISTERRQHPEVLEEDLSTKWWNGYSTGTWDGDTFVVDTTNLRDETWLDNLGHEHRQLRVVERFRRLDPETLEIERTFTDPMALARPYVTTATLKLAPDLTPQENVICDQYYGRKIGFGFQSLLGISSHPWQGKDRSTENPGLPRLPR